MLRAIDHPTSLLYRLIMPFILVQIRPVGDKRGSWYVRRSDAVGDLSGRFDRTLAILRVRQMATECGTPMLVLVHNHRDSPEEAYAVKGENWRNLSLIARHPRRGEGTGL